MDNKIATMNVKLVAFKTFQLRQTGDRIGWSIDHNDCVFEIGRNVADARYAWGTSHGVCDIARQNLEVLVDRVVLRTG